MRFFKNLWKSDEGSIAVETAIVTPILIFIFLPAVDLGVKVYTLQKMNKAADSGIEYVVNGGRNEDIARNIMGDSFGQNIKQSDLTIEAYCGCIVPGTSDGNDGNNNSGEGFPADQYAGYYVKTLTSLSDEMCSTTCSNGSDASELIKVEFSQTVEGIWTTDEITTHLQTRVK